MNNAIQLKAADAFASAHGYSASVVRLRNTSDVSIDYSVSGGDAVKLAAGASAVVDVAALTSEIAVRRTDLSTTPVNVMLEFGLDPDEAYVFAIENAPGSTTSVAAADITDAGTAGIAVLQSETQAQVLEAVGADPSGTAATAVSTHNTATDSHADIRTALAGKQDAGANRGLYSGIMSETVPTQSSTGLTTWVNQGTASATDTSIGLQVVNPTTSSNDNIRGLVRTVPDTPYTLTALLELASVAGNYPCALLGWADDASTKTHLVALCGDGRSGLVTAGSYASFAFSDDQFTREGRRAWLQLADDGTTITVKWSWSGVYWHTLYSKDKESSHLGSEGYNRLFFGASSGNITGVATLLSWSIS